ncbi:MAG TPA: hypothetical protein VJ792_09865 [Candidatus Nitrosotalea sp.]|nr:hypothetical protein [Candidatus Nitrosotalea sp.]
MECEEEYNELTALTEKLHELYYQQENAEFAFSNALSSAQNHLIATGLVSLTSATAAEILNTLEDTKQDGFAELHDAASSKVQLDAAVRSLEESYRDASKRYDECLKETEKKIVRN